jgi:hypothetical protein
MKKIVENSKKVITMAAAVASIFAIAALAQNLAKNLGAINPPEVEDSEAIVNQTAENESNQNNSTTSDNSDTPVTVAPEQIQSQTASRLSSDAGQLQLVKTDIDIYATKNQLIEIKVGSGCEGEGEARIVPGGKLVFRNDTCEIITLVTK